MGGFSSTVPNGSSGTEQGWSEQPPRHHFLGTEVIIIFGLDIINEY